MKRTIPATVMLAVALAGCGSSSKASGGEVRPADVAAKAGCTDTFTMQTTEEFFARELGTCTINGAELSLYTFASNKNRDDWYDVGSNFGGMFLVLDRAIIKGESRAALEAAKAKAGGDLR